MDQACVGMHACRWAYILGREGLSLVRQKLVRRQLWSGFTTENDVSHSDVSDDEDECSGNSGFQVSTLSLH